jgi:hypothetical protein
MVLNCDGSEYQFVSTPLLYYFTEQLDSDTIGSHDLRGRVVSSLAEQSRQRREILNKARERKL